MSIYVVVIYYWQGDDHGAMELRCPCATGPTLTSGEETQVGAWDVIPSRWLVYENFTLASASGHFSLALPLAEGRFL